MARFRRPTRDAMNEFELIRQLTADLATGGNVIVGPGDDCAVVDVGQPDHWLLLKTDAVVEGVHFMADAPPEKIGHKALGRALSDIAAMAGEPQFALITLALPESYETGRIQGIYRGMNDLAARHGVGIVGGETTRNPGGLLISIALTGCVRKGKVALRSGAKPGDAIFVSGELGGSIAGHHLEFEPRVKEAACLAEHVDLHAMVDISDGLAGDLRHLMTASGCGCELMARMIPIRRAARLRAREDSHAKPALLAALTDGEDFELLFTVAAAEAVRVKDVWQSHFPETPLSCIGRVTEGAACQIATENGVTDLPKHGYVHFQQP